MMTCSGLAPLARPTLIRVRQGSVVSSKGARIMFETLENRLMFDSNPLDPQVPEGISFNNGIVAIKGAASADTTVVSLVNRQLHVTLKRVIWMTTDWGSGPVTVEDAAQTFNPASVQKVVFYGLGNDDKFTNETSKPSYASGGSGNDELTGGSGIDELHGNGEDDELFGRGGNDSVFGGSGSDLLVGGTGSDYLHAKDGNAGNDTLFGDNMDGSGDAGTTDTAVIDMIGNWTLYDNFSNIEELLL
jgi:Ca2+-binding RTX toxin-like protein